MTGIFSMLVILRLGLGKNTKSGRDLGMNIVSFLFMLEIIVLFVYFIISGNPEGFSSLWIAMLPACGMLVFGRKKATVLSIVIFVILIFFFWIPIGKSFLQYHYTKTFLMRFPILYVAFFLLSALFESIRLVAQNELDKMRKNYEYLYAHDYLTGLLNRHGLFDEIKQQGKVDKDHAVMMIDIDYFKKINDNFGHDAGDVVLQSVAKAFADHKNANVCRWGGEEFVLWFSDAEKMSDPYKLCRAVERMPIYIRSIDQELSVTISIGVARGRGTMTELIEQADVLLYKAKQNGRNRVEETEWKKQSGRNRVEE